MTIDFDAESFFDGEGNQKKLDLLSQSKDEIKPKLYIGNSISNHTENQNIVVLTAYFFWIVKTLMVTYDMKNNK